MSGSMSERRRQPLRTTASASGWRSNPICPASGGGIDPNPGIYVLRDRACQLLGQGARPRQGGRPLATARPGRRAQLQARAHGRASPERDSSLEGLSCRVHSRCKEGTCRTSLCLRGFRGFAVPSRFLRPETGRPLSALAGVLLRDDNTFEPRRTGAYRRLRVEPQPLRALARASHSMFAGPCSSTEGWSSVEEVKQNPECPRIQRQAPWALLAIAAKVRESEAFRSLPRTSLPPVTRERPMSRFTTRSRSRPRSACTTVTSTGLQR